MQPNSRLSISRPHRNRLFFLSFLSLAAIVQILHSAPVTNNQTDTDQQKPISITSELVEVPVSVTDSQGNFVPGLARENFRIYENNHPQEVTLFEQENTPVSVGLLVDHSSSMESKLPGIATAISGFAHSSNPEDEMFVVNFGDSVKVESPGGKPFTSNAAEIQGAVLAVSASGKTALYDAVAAGLNHLRLARWQKKALIIVSDGGDNASWYKYSQIRAKARESQVAIYSIGLVDELGEEESPRILEQLCRDTGGIAFFPRSGIDVIESTAHIARDLREQYMLGFTPSHHEGGEEFHKIQVRVVAPQHGKLHVRARPGYAVGNVSSSPPSERDTP